MPVVGGLTLVRASPDAMRTMRKEWGIGRTLTAHVVAVMLRVLLMQGMICTMGVRGLTAGMVMPVMMVTMLAMHVLVAVMTFAVMHVLGIRCTGRGRWSWTRL